MSGKYNQANKSFSLALQLGHNSTVAIAADGCILGILSQEKIDNIKNSSSFPAPAILALLEELKIKPGEINQVLICGDYVPVAFLSDDPRSHEGATPSILRYLLRRAKGRVVKLKIAPAYYWLRLGWLRYKNRGFSRHLDARLADLGILDAEVKNIDHHTCHAYSAAFFYGSKVSKRLIFTLDGEGDDSSGTVWKQSGNELKCLVRLPIDVSLGHFFSGVTQFLGMRALEHEYKVMGLAPYAKQEHVQKLFNELFKSKFIVSDDAIPRVHMAFDATQTKDYLKQRAANARFDNLSGAAQMVLETIVPEWITKTVERLGITDIAVSGGVFMNVKLNKILQERDEITSINFAPSCGDESNVLGAVFKDAVDRGLAPNSDNSQMYSGLSTSDSDAEKHLAKFAQSHQLRVAVERNIETKVAELLAKGHVVARVAGKNEWGARSLGNRAILGHPGLYETFDFVNEAIKSRDFWMPFAPSILDVDAPKYLLNFDPLSPSSQFMITAFDTTELGKKRLCASIHRGDGTCRPQIVIETKTPSYYRLISEFRRLTGTGAVLNTSLNLHGYPLACTVEQVMFTYLNSELRYLAIGKHLVSKP